MKTVKDTVYQWFDEFAANPPLMRELPDWLEVRLWDFTKERGMVLTQVDELREKLDAIATCCRDAEKTCCCNAPLVEEILGIIGDGQ